MRGGHLSYANSNDFTRHLFIQEPSSLTSRTRPEKNSARAAVVDIGLILLSAARPCHTPVRLENLASTPHDEERHTRRK